MKNASKLLFLLLIALSMGCKKQTVGLNEEFTLDFNKSATVKAGGDKIRIKFNKLVEESRCPPNTECVWAGEVAVRIQLDGESKSTIGFHSAYLSGVEYKDHIIQLLEVNYDGPGNYGKESHYSIRLKVK